MGGEATGSWRDSGVGGNRGQASAARRVAVGQMFSGLSVVTPPAADSRGVTAGDLAAGGGGGVEGLVGEEAIAGALQEALGEVLETAKEPAWGDRHSSEPPRTGAGAPSRRGRR